MTITLNETIKAFNGKLYYADQASKDPITMRTFIIEALMFDGEEAPLPGTKKLELYKLAQAVHEAADTIILTSEQVALIKQRGSKLWTIGLYGAAMEMLNE